MQLTQTRRALLSVIIRDWDKKTSFAAHTHNWQQHPDPWRYQLIASALGGYRKTVEPYVPFNMLKRWALSLDVDLPETPKCPAHLASERLRLLNQLIADWDRSTPFKIHAHDWQQDHYELVADALGGYRKTAKPYVPFRTLKTWAQKLDVQLPDRQHLINTLVEEWDRTIPFHIHARQRHPDVPYQNIRNWVIKTYGTYPPPGRGPD